MIPVTIPKVTLQELQQRATQANSVVRLPVFERSARAIKKSAADCVSQSKQALDKIGSRSSKKINFKNTVAVLDNINAEIGEFMARIYFLDETTPKDSLRIACTKTVKRLAKVFVDFESRKDVYRAVKQCYSDKKKLKGEDRLLLIETLDDFEDGGMTLPKKTRKKIANIEKRLAVLESMFDTNLGLCIENLKFKKQELSGVPDNFLNQKDIKTGPDEYTLQAHNNGHLLMVLENARLEATRQKFLETSYNLGRRKNIPLLQKILLLRHKHARLLGHPNFADYMTSTNMVGGGKKAIKFLKKLRKGLQPKYKAEQELFRQLKVADTKNPEAQLMTWDWRYYANQHAKKKFSVNADELRAYFPLPQVLAGLFHTVGISFGIKVEEVEPPYKWVNDLRLFAVSDAKTAAPLGLVYFDLFPRKHKYNHFAMFDLIAGRLLPNGLRQCSVCAVVGNFTPPSDGKPALLSYDEVTTMFHEFGHTLHALLTKTKYKRFSGTSVTQDFLEVPSQLLEGWAHNPKTLNLFAADYRDASKKIPSRILHKIEQAQLASQGHSFSRQLSFGLLDLTLHTKIRKHNVDDLAEISNRVLNKVAIPMPAKTAFIASFSHLNNYSAGYYGYAWSDAIVADITAKFQRAKYGFLDSKLGLKVRRKIYEVGGSKDCKKSIKAVLGRNFKLKPFLRQVGIET